MKVREPRRQATLNSFVVFDNNEDDRDHLIRHLFSEDAVNKGTDSWTRVISRDMLSDTVCGIYPIGPDLQYACLTCGQCLPALLVDNAEIYALVSTTHTTSFVIAEFFLGFQSPAANGG